MSKKTCNPTIIMVIFFHSVSLCDEAIANTRIYTLVKTIGGHFEFISQFVFSQKPPKTTGLADFSLQ